MPVDSSSDSSDRLPFEPAQKKKAKNERKTDVPVKKSKAKRQERVIPPVVSRRMLKRMAIFSGIPSGIGVSAFFVFYYVTSNELFEFPPALVLITTLGCFGLGFIGLNYGIFSASWDEHRVGSWLGWQDAKLNFKRIRTSQKDAKQERDAYLKKRAAEKEEKRTKKAARKAEKSKKRVSNDVPESAAGFQSDAKTPQKE